MRGRMHVILFILISAACTHADNPNRRTKLPYIADAVGNSLPPPSNAPATVGSPVNLLTPDRYEFYTFDESGELIKRLMTLEEIQAIVAAGEETDGLVTFANDNQPTIAFNFSQPSHSKVHNVVTNVQNVLKAQMEAQKNKPNIQPTFDTPDVSDSWSLILPSIFGNTGVDIVPDKTSGSFITPETETIDVDFNTEYENSKSKESNEIPTAAPEYEKHNIIPVKALDKVTLSTTTSTTTKRPVISLSTRKVSTVGITSTTTESTSTTNKLTTTKIQKVSTSSSTLSPPSTIVLVKSTTDQTKLSENSTTGIKNQYKTSTDNTVTSTAPSVQYEKFSTYLPIFSIPDMTDSAKLPNIEQSHKNELSDGKEIEKNISSVTSTQSLSPSSTASSVEFTSENIKITNNNEREKDTLTSLPLFDVAESISQIASDLGNNFAPIPTSNSLLETTKTNNMDIESKENVEIEIPTDVGNNSDVKTNPSTENFVQVSMLDPHTKDESTKEKDEIVTINDIQTTSLPLTTITELSTTNNNVMDPILTGSMDDLLSQVVHEGPDPTSIIVSDNSTKSEIDLKSEKETTLVTKVAVSETTTSSASLKPTMPAKYNKKDAIKRNNTNNISYKTNDILKIPKTNVTGTGTNKINFNNQTIFGNNKQTNHTKNINSGENKKVTVQTASPILHGSSVFSHLNSTSDKIESSTIHNIDIKKQTVTLVLQEKYSEQNNKFNDNKPQKPFEEKNKFDDYKKKVQKVNIDEKELANERNNSWKLIPTVTPPKLNDINKEKHKVEGFYTPETNNKDIILEFPKENQGLEVTTRDLGKDVQEFTELCNDLAFRYWKAVTENINKKRSMVFSPYSITSMLAMMFMGAKGATSGEMNEILKLDDMVTFNPHFTLKNISDSIETTTASGVAVSAFIRELFSERGKGKILTFYKERAQHFYNGHVEEINFKLISDIIRRRTNLLVKRYTWGKITEYMKSNNMIMHPPLAAFAANLFYTDCTGTSVEGRDGEMYFVVSPSIRQRRLVPVPAVVYKSNFLAGYDPVLDATAAALGNTNSIISTLFLMPGQQGNVVHVDDLENLEKRILDADGGTPAWNKLLRTLLPRNGLELQVPRFSHKSIFNISSALQNMGVKELFNAEHADLGGMNGPSKDLYLSDMIQLTSFVTCGEGHIADQHHIEEYPESLEILQKQRSSRWLTGWDEPRDYQRAFHDPHDVEEALYLPLHLRPRQARLPARTTQPARLKFDRPFLFFVRHNPSGMILYVGRYNPRLLP